VAWLEYLTAHRAEAAAFLAGCIGEVLGEWLRDGDAGQTRRVARRFAQVAAAGELAGRAGLTGWAPGECERAARRQFERWLASRGTRGDAEELAALRHVAAQLAERGASNFVWWHRASDDRAPNPPMRWGLRRLLDGETPIETNSQFGARFGIDAEAAGDGDTAAEYFVTVPAFRAHLCAGFDSAFVARVLAKRGHLKPESATRLDRKERLPGIGPARVYRIAPSIFADPAL
jgi:putative DNA primase/helicase